MSTQFESTPAQQHFTHLPPTVRELPSDLETPVSVYLKLAGEGPSFLLESITGGEALARYSFIGVRPSRACVIRGENYEIHDGKETLVKNLQGLDPLDILRQELEPCRSEPLPGLPRFNGGLVGYMGYEMMRFFEPNVGLQANPDLPDAIFLLADTLVAFDHAFGRLLLIARPRPAESQAAAIAEVESRLDGLQALLDRPIPNLPLPGGKSGLSNLVSNIKKERFMDLVGQAKEHIAAGDIFQVLLSQRLSRSTTASPFSIYRALRHVNPSPYMFFFDFDKLAGQPGLQLIGASPELHVRLEGSQASLRPIAGTSRRSIIPEEDAKIEHDLLADPKERAEHVMLVDLARNDLGRVCEFGSVHVPEQMVIERYSHVMHIVSHVEGTLRPGLDAFDLMKATFPAGTVSGAPKIRAMQIINDLENDPRGTYAGAVGYFAGDGSMDTCITIRTLMMRGSQICVQAGAGIVADSDPEREYQETLNKARALAVAIEMAETRPVFSFNTPRTLSQEILIMIVVIDNYDSFTYNLVQYLGELGCEISIYRNDALTPSQLEALNPSHIVISPGPGDPNEAGISLDVIRQLGSKIPILGVCLGHQCIGAAYGGRVVRAPRLMHGKTSPIYHYGKDLFMGLPSPFEATRYHSLIVADPLPACLQMTAYTNDGEVMGIRHKEHPVFGVQFHPESILTFGGRTLLKNFLAVEPMKEEGFYR